MVWLRCLRGQLFAIFILLTFTAESLWAFQFCSGFFQNSGALTRIHSVKPALIQLLAVNALQPTAKKSVDAALLYRKYKNDDSFANWLTVNAEHLSSSKQALRLYRSVQAKPTMKAAVIVLDLSVNQLQDLSQVNRSNPINRDKLFVNESRDGLRIGPEFLTRYEEAIISLRKGDGVILPKVSGYKRISESEFLMLEDLPKFYITEKSDNDKLVYLIPQYSRETMNVILGDFLGSGNQTVVFALKDWPGFAIRLPFRTLRMRNINGGREVEFVDSRLSLFDMVKVAPETRGSVEVVKVYGFGPGGEFIIVNQFNGRFSGSNFYRKHVYLLARFSRRGLMSSDQLPKDQLLALANSSTYSVEALLKIHSMYWKLLRANENILTREDMGFHQLLWNVDTQDWALVEY